MAEPIGYIIPGGLPALKTKGGWIIVHGERDGSFTEPLYGAGTEPSDRQIIELAKASGILTGENLRRGDDYLFRSMGTPTNVFGSHLIEFARAVRAWSGKPSRPTCDDCDNPTLCADFPDQHRVCPT